MTFTTSSRIQINPNAVMRLLLCLLFLLLLLLLLLFLVANTLPIVPLAFFYSVPYPTPLRSLFNFNKISLTAPFAQGTTDHTSASHFTFHISH